VISSLTNTRSSTNDWCNYFRRGSCFSRCSYYNDGPEFIKQESPSAAGLVTPGFGGFSLAFFLGAAAPEGRKSFAILDLGSLVFPGLCLTPGPGLCIMGT
jgi:hypothetical protein